MSNMFFTIKAGELLWLKNKKKLIVNNIKRKYPPLLRKSKPKSKDAIYKIYWKLNDLNHFFILKNNILKSDQFFILTVLFSLDISFQTECWFKTIFFIEKIFSLDISEKCFVVLLV